MARHHLWPIFPSGPALADCPACLPYTGVVSPTPGVGPARQDALPSVPAPISSLLPSLGERCQPAVPRPKGGWKEPHALGSFLTLEDSLQNQGPSNGRLPGQGPGLRRMEIKG